MADEGKKGGVKWEVLDVQSLPPPLQAQYNALIGSYIKGEEEEYEENRAKFYKAVAAGIPCKATEEVSVVFRAPRIDVALIPKKADKVGAGIRQGTLKFQAKRP